MLKLPEFCNLKSSGKNQVFKKLQLRHLRLEKILLIKKTRSSKSK